MFSYQYKTNIINTVIFQRQVLQQQSINFLVHHNETARAFIELQQ